MKAADTQTILEETKTRFLARSSYSRMGHSRNSYLGWPILGFGAILMGRDRICIGHDTLWHTECFKTSIYLRPLSLDRRALLCICRELCSVYVGTQFGRAFGYPLDWLWLRIKLTQLHAWYTYGPTWPKQRNNEQACACSCCEDCAWWICQCK